jgi:hypothetical protein
VLLIVLYQFVPARAKKKVDGMDIPKTKEWLHLHESPLYYLNKSVVDDSKLGSHVLGVAVVAMPLSAYPLSHIALAATTLSACPAPAWAIVFFAVLCLLSSAAWVYLINRF